MYIHPKQTEQDKNEEWKRNNIDYWINQASFGVGTFWSELGTLYRAAEGELIKDDYKYILDPRSTTNERFKNFPAQMRNLSIIKPVIRAFLGEQITKPNNFQVVAANADDTNGLLDKLQEARFAYWAQDLVNKMNETGIPTNVDSKKLPPLEEEEERVRQTYRQDRALFGQEALDFIRYSARLDDKYQEALYHWIVSGSVFSYRELFFDDVDLTVIHPKDIWYLPHTISPFIEDASAVVRRSYMNFNSVIDYFRDKFSTETLAELETKSKVITNQNANMALMKTEWDLSGGSTSNSDYTIYKYLLNGGFVTVDHVQWKTVVEIGFLDYLDPETGTIQTMEVDRNYVLDPNLGDISLTKQFINQVYEGWKIANEYYTEINPIPVQRNELNNISECKLSYNGRVFSRQDGSRESLVKDGLAYQALYNIYHYRREMMINKNKDKIMFMPKGLIPEDLAGGGADAYEAFLYHLEATSTAWLDETKPNFQAIISALKGIDMGLGTYINDITNILENIRNEYWDAVGMNRQRYGQVMASDGKYTTEQALVRSNVITAEYFRMFDSFVESDYNCLLDYSRVAWKKGKKGQYINSEEKISFFKLEDDYHSETSYGIFCKNNSKEQLKRDTLISLSQSFAQDPNVRKSVVAEMITGNSVSKITEYIKQAEEAQLKMQQQMEDNKNETAKYVADKQQAIADKADETKRYEIDEKIKSAEKIALMQSQATVLGYDQGVDGADDSNLLIQTYLDNLNEEKKLALKDKEINIKDKISRNQDAFNLKQLAFKHKELASKERIAKSRGTK